MERLGAGMKGKRWRARLRSSGARRVTLKMGAGQYLVVWLSHGTTVSRVMVNVTMRISPESKFLRAPGWQGMFIHEAERVDLIHSGEGVKEVAP